MGNIIIIILTGCTWHGQKVGMDESAARGVLGVKRIAWDGM